MKKNCKYLLILFMFIFVSCDNYNLTRWKIDKKANNNFRTIENTNELFKKINIKELNSNEVIKLLGNPDKIIHIDNSLHFEYFIENNCELQDTDCCILTISFYNKKKANISITCS